MSGAHPKLHVLTHSSPTRRSADLCFRARHPLLAIPDLMIGARPGDHVIAKLLGERRDFGMNPRVRGRRRAHNAARVIAAGGDRVEQHLVQPLDGRSEEHTSELQSLMRISYAVFCLKKKTKD